MQAGVTGASQDFRDRRLVGMQTTGGDRLEHGPAGALVEVQAARVAAGQKAARLGVQTPLAT